LKKNGMINKTTNQTYSPKVPPNSSQISKTNSPNGVKMGVEGGQNNQFLRQGVKKNKELKSLIKIVRRDETIINIYMEHELK